MKKYIAITSICCLFSAILFAQTGRPAEEKTTSVFERMTASAADFQPDTSSLPNDSITGIIMELRTVRGGFNIDEAVEFKIEEARQKNEISQTAADSLLAFFTTGNGKKQLDNAVMWIYRKHFTYEELQQIVAFYKSSAGQKFATEFPFVVLESFKAAELIQKNYAGGQKK